MNSFGYCVQLTLTALQSLTLSVNMWGKSLEKTTASDTQLTLITL